MDISGIFSSMFLSSISFFIKHKTFVGMIVLVISLMNCGMFRMSNDIVRVMHLWR